MNARPSPEIDRTRELAAEAPPRRRRGLRAALVGAIALIAMAFAAPGASAEPWSCSAFGYLFQSPEGISGEHNIEQVDLATGEFENIDETDAVVNAVGYNVLDDFMYGIGNEEVGPGENERSLVRIHNDGSLEELPWPATLPPPTEFSSAVGDVNSEGHYLIASGETTYLIDLEPGSPEYGEVIEEGEYGSPAGYASPLDIAYIDGAYYGVARTSPPSSEPALLMRFTLGGEPENLGELASVPGNGTYGAVYADAADYLYAANNSTGLIYRIDPDSGESILVSEGPKSGTNDGARCAAAPIPTVTLEKEVEGRVQDDDQFTVGLVTEAGKTVESATTTGSETSVSTTNFPVSQGQTYEITDAMAPGSSSTLDEYVESIDCVDGEGDAVATGGEGPDWTLAIDEATNYTCTVTNAAEADLSIAKSVTPAPLVPGEEAKFILTVANHGPSTSTGETVTDQLPEEFALTSASAGCSQAGAEVTCAVGELAPGDTQTFELTGMVDGSLRNCLANTATVSGSFDPDTGNNSASVCAPIEGRIDLSIQKTASTNEVEAGGGQVIYTLVIRNLGPSDATGVRVADPMAEHLTLASAEPSQGTCSTEGDRVSCGLGALRAGGSAQILVTASTDSTPGTTDNTATVRGDQVEANLDNNQDAARVLVPEGPEPPPSGFDLVVRKRADVKRPTVGQAVTYTIVVGNRGPDAASGVALTDTLNSPSRLLAARSSAGKCSRAIPLRCELGEIAAGEHVTVKIRLRPLRAGCRQRNAASATGEGTDANPGNNMDVVGFCVRKARLGLRKVANRVNVPAGGRVTYLIRVSNLTKGIARRVRVCDRLPSGLAYAGSKPRGTLRKGRLCWNVRWIGPRKTKVFRVVARALRGTAGRKVNRAVAASPDARPARAKRAVRVVGRGTSPRAGGVTG